LSVLLVPIKSLFRNRLFLFTGALVFLGLSQLIFSIQNVDPKRDAVEIANVLHQKEKRLESELAQLLKNASGVSETQLFSKRPAYYNTLFKDEGLVLLIYDNDTLKFWSDNSVAVENYMKEVCLDDHMAKLKNGWFEVVKQRISNSRSAVGLIHIKSEFPYQNHYLINSFQHDFKVPAGTRLSINEGQSNYPIVKNSKGEFLFSIHPAAILSSDEDNVGILPLLLNLIGLILLVLFFELLSEKLAPVVGTTMALLLFVGLISAVRLLSIQMRFPVAFYHTVLFGPKFFGDARSAWLPSLGDLLLNAMLLFYLAFYISRNWKIKFPGFRYPRIQENTLAFLLFLSVFWLSWLIDGLFKGLIHNSEIAFNVNELFSLNLYSFIGIFIIGLLLFSFFLYANKVLDFLFSSQLPPRQLVFLFISAAGFHVLICYLTGLLDLVSIGWSFLLLSVIGGIKRGKVKTYTFSGSIVLVMILTLYSVHTFLKHTRMKENDNRKVYAEKLATEQDPIAEHLYPEIEPLILDDTTLLLLAHPKTFNLFEKRLMQRYFSGYWEKYDIRIAYFDTACNSINSIGKSNSDNISHFDDLITKSGQETFCSNLYYLQNLSGKISYLAKIPITRYEGDPNPAHLIISLESKFISEEIGFPELLLDRDLGISQQIANYSFAKYRNGKLINQYGKYHYPVVPNVYAGYETPFSFTLLDGYNHLIFRPDLATLILISKPDPGLLGYITTFSYLFTFYSLLLLFLLLLYQIIWTDFSLSSLTFKARIQSILVFIVLTSLALFGFGTVYYIRQQYEMKNTENITEKLQSVLVEADNRLDMEELDKNYRDYSSYILKKLSNIFFTDINLYDANGNLYVSSRPEVFDEGLVSKKMNPEAYLQMGVRKKSEFVHDENIGDLNYLSAYIPFKNRNGKQIAFLNLPYFAKQSELQKEISTFLVALINIYVLLFAMSILVAIAISNYLTRPLKLIQDKMSNVKLGKTNELIEWHQQDEIGSLIREYNRMIEELAKSVELLAKSERESAWREMARQVAHEIKNPLTPMKLSIQHLQRLIDDKSPDLENKMRRMATTLIEQIDTLSSIASEFSSFANMPKAIAGKLDLKQTVATAIELFSEYPEAEINFSVNGENREWFVLADKEQLLRVFNNLIKNAIQAVPPDRKGKIQLSMDRSSEGHFVVAVADNGIGIPQELFQKIFVPNFTTKTGGMGLGLAMVKNILENFNGKIWFSTCIGHGSVFYVSLPEYEGPGL
jgi:two-component system nitrogen regulation sensor histidine kinase NtrY